MTATDAGDGGFSLIEILVATLVMSIAVVAVLGTLQAAIGSGVLQRGLSTSELALRSFAEHIKSEQYVECASPAAYGGFAAPVGHTASIIDVRYWAGSAASMAFTPACPPDGGLQQVRIRVVSSVTGATHETWIVKRDPTP